MELYVVIIIIFVFLSRIRIKGIREKSKLAFAMTFLYLLASMRSVTVGNDTWRYARSFDLQYDASVLSIFIGRLETGYVYLNMMIRKFTTDFNLFLSIINLYIYNSYYLFIKKYSSNYLFSVLLFLCFGFWGQTVNVIRLQLAVATYIYAYILMDNRDNRLWGILGLLGTFFQRISLSSFYYLFIPKRLTKKFYYVSTCFTIVLYIVFTRLIEIIILIFPYYGVYLKSSSRYQLGVVYIAIIIKCIMLFCVWSISLIVYRANRFKLKKSMKGIMEYQINMVFVSILIYFLSLKFNLLNRCAVFYELFMIVLIPNMLKLVSDRRKYVVLWWGGVLLAVSYFLIVQIFRPEWNHIYPYHTFWYDK